MFATKQNSTKSTLLCGAQDVVECFTFEAAIHFAEEGKRAFYITPAPLNAFPAMYHDRCNPSHSAFNLIRFLYLPTYEALVEQLVALHTFASLPEILLIDKLDHYIGDVQVNEQQDTHTAKLCAILHDSMNACGRILDKQLYLCASINSTKLDNTFYHLYFTDIWCCESIKRNEEISIKLSRALKKSGDKMHEVFYYRRFEDGCLILEKIFKQCEND